MRSAWLFLRSSPANKFSAHLMPAQTPPGPPSTNGMSGPPSNISPAFLAQSRVGDIYAAVIAVTVLCTIAVARRFRCRRIVKANLWWDDWTILAALLIEWSLSAVLPYETANLNFGRHIGLVQNWQLVPFFKVSPSRFG